MYGTRLKFGFATLVVWGMTLALFTPAQAQTFSPTGSMNVTRYGHTATLLNNGKVLIVGGKDNTNSALTSAELYDPAGNGGAGSFTPTGSMTTARISHTATLLQNGKVLIAGGANTTVIATAEVYDPAGNGGAGSFSSTGDMTAPRQLHTATLLPNGKVLIAGGFGNGYVSSAELYDPTGNSGAGSFAATGSMSTARYRHTATLLQNGKALIAGGIGSSNTPVASAEVYDPAGNSGAGSFSSTGSMSTARDYHTATLLNNGKTLITGGTSDGSTFLASAELYDPAGNGGTGSFAATGSMSMARYRHTATLLQNGQALIAGGSNDTVGIFANAELYDPAGNGGAGSFTPTGSLGVARDYHKATLLQNGKVLISGGVNSGDQVISSAELFAQDILSSLVLQNSSAQQVAFWATQGATITGGAYVLSGGAPITLPPNWQIVATGDFNADGTTDLVLDNTNTGQIAFWFVSGNTITGGVYATAGGGNIGVPPGWQIVGAGDFNGDGKPDLVLDNPGSGQIAVWTLNGTDVTSGAYVTSGGGIINFPPGWQVVGVGDFNADGHPDLVLDNTNTGQIAVWTMNGTDVTSGVYVTNGGSPILLPAGWQITAIGDYNADGKPDLVLENLGTRQLAFWYLNGTALSGSSYALQGGAPITLPGGWQVNGPR